MDMIFGEGPILSGHWYNPSTGDSFTVRDTYFEDNNLYVITTDGRRLNYDIISKYVQSDKPIPKQPNMAQQQTNTLPVELANQILNPVSSDFNDSEFGILEDDMALISGQVNSQDSKEKAITRDQFNINSVKQTLQEDEDTMLIRRILSRAKKPEILCNINWDFPRKQMEMLEMMCVDFEKIADYYINNMDLNEIRKILKQDLINHINILLNCKNSTEKAITLEEKPVEEKSVETKVKQVKKKTNKK
jgi:hypothetical protein